MEGFYEKLTELADKKVPFVSVIMVDAQGSVPQNVGAKMLVTEEGLFYGTVGGGKVEMRALQESVIMLTESGLDKRTKFVNWALDRDIGMTCGGSVRLFFETFNLNNWNLVVFGAGHVANALVNVLINLDCKITCIDSRLEWLDKLPESPKLRKILASDMPAQVSSLPEESYVVLMTMGHTTDKPILLQVLSTRRFPYVGVIGSKAKAVRLKSDIRAAGLRRELEDAFHCPIGLNLGSNHPQEIAISVAAQLLKYRDASTSTIKSTFDEDDNNA